MRRLSIGGKEFEISERYYLSSISHLAKGYYVLAEAYNNYHEAGFADWKGVFQMPDVGQNEVEKAFLNQIDDEELFNAFNSLKDQLQEIKEVDRHIMKWLVGFVGMSPVQDKKSRAYLERRLKKIIINTPDGHPQGPVWVIHPEYQAFVERSKNILAVMSKTQRRIDQRIEQLLESTPKV